MSLNPPQDFNGNPLRVQHEYFIMKRSDMKYTLSFENSSVKYQGAGTVILTTCRVIIVNANRVDSLKAYELPLSMIIDEKYCQPLMGTNYVTGNCFPMFGNNLGKVNFTLTFTQTCGTFVTGLFLLLDSLRAHENKGHDKTITEAIRNNTFNLVFPVDKNDPSDFIYDQPDEIPALKPISQSVVQNEGQVMRGMLNEAGVSVINPIDFNPNPNVVMNKNEEGFKNNGFEYKQPPQYEYKSVQLNARGGNQLNNQKNWVNPYLPKHIVEQNQSKIYASSINEKVYEENKKEFAPQMSQISGIQQPKPYQQPQPIQIHPPQILPPVNNPYGQYPSFDDNSSNKYIPPVYGQDLNQQENLKPYSNQQGGNEFNLFNNQKDYKDALLDKNFPQQYSNQFQ